MKSPFKEAIESKAFDEGAKFALESIIKRMRQLQNETDKSTPHGEDRFRLWAHIDQIMCGQLMQFNGGEWRDGIWSIKKEAQEYIKKRNQ
jgi:hypothetical protein